MLRIPREIVWDYPDPPIDPAWRRQRLAEFFPSYGRDKESVAELYAHRDEVRVTPEVRELIGIYARVWGLTA